MSQAKPHSSPRDAGRNLLRNLFDLEFTVVISTQMLPAIYGLALLLSALASLYCIVWAFGQSWWLGLAWLLLIGPALFLALVTTVRVVLEFVLTVFRISFYVETLGNQVEGIADQTEGIAEGLPRIRFWRSLKAENKDAGEKTNE